MATRKVKIGPATAFLLSHVEHKGAACLIWPYAIHKLTGYGVVGVPGQYKTTRAHRRMCELAHGPAPFARADAAHSCGVRACVNPNHIRWATRKENLADRDSHGTTPRGEAHHAAKLTAQDVLMICKSTGSNEDIALGLGVDRKAVAAVRDGVSWRWLTGKSLREAQPREGENSPNHRFSKEDVLQMYSDPRPHREIAADFGCDASHISRIKSGNVWASVTGHTSKGK